MDFNHNTEIGEKMHVSYLTYFWVIAFPFLVFFLPAIVGLVLTVIKIIKKKNHATNDLLFYILLLCFILFFFRDRLLPSVRLVMDVGAQHSYAEGRVNYKRFDQSYNHLKYSGWIIDVDSEQYYILEDTPVPQGDDIRIEYLPHSRMIISWERIEE